MNKTAKVRVRLMLNADGNWAAYGWDGADPGDEHETLYAMMEASNTDNVRFFDLVTELPIHTVEVVPVEVDAIPAEDSTRG